jgi:phosphoribosyl 1,2-cyclic phosphodiesterase
MLVRFWGVRGSVPWSRREAAAYGCNTPCVEVRDEATGAMLILDAGTGLVALGESLPHEAADVSILLSHFHWDHTQGLPFFAPFYRAGWAVNVWAPALPGIRTSHVDALFETPFFPVQREALRSAPVTRLIGAGEDVDVGGFHVRAAPLNHPGGALAYRIRGSAGDLVYASDHEFGNAEADATLAQFSLNSGATILDAHFTPEELPAHAGWGHASWRQSAEFASATGAGHLWVFHHKPGRTDRELDDIEARTRRVYPASRAAREGDWFKL